MEKAGQYIQMQEWGSLCIQVFTPPGAPPHRMPFVPQRLGWSGIKSQNVQQLHERRLSAHLSCSVPTRSCCTEPSSSGLKCLGRCLACARGSIQLVPSCAFVWPRWICYQDLPCAGETCSAGDVGGTEAFEVSAFSLWEETENTMVCCGWQL